MSSSYIIILIIMLAACYFLFVRKPKTPVAQDAEVNKAESVATADQKDEGDTV